MYAFGGFSLFDAIVLINAIPFFFLSLSLFLACIRATPFAYSYISLSFSFLVDVYINGRIKARARAPTHVYAHIRMYTRIRVHAYTGVFR